MLAAAVVATVGCKGGKDNKNDKEVTEQNDDDDDDDDDGGCHESQLERESFTFKTEVVADEDGVAEKIIVHMMGTNGSMPYSLTQEISAVPLDTNLWQGFGTVREDDINFDGTPDLMVCRGPFNGYGNFSYYAWVWDWHFRDFVDVEGFEDLFDPVFNKEDSTVTSSFRMDDHEDDTVYKWDSVGSSLKEVSSETIVYDELYDE